MFVYPSLYAVYLQQLVDTLMENCVWLQFIVCLYILIKTAWEVMVRLVVVAKFTVLYRWHSRSQKTCQIWQTKSILRILRVRSSRIPPIHISTVHPKFIEAASVCALLPSTQNCKKTRQRYVLHLFFLNWWLRIRM